MFAWVKKLFADARVKAAKDRGVTVEMPRKVKGAMHPLVRAKQEAWQRARALGCGIVYDAEGRPKITEDWVKNLSYVDRQAVDQNLDDHGWRIHGNAVVPIEGDR